jgi:hypothetical protein
LVGVAQRPPTDSEGEEESNESEETDEQLQSDTTRS